MSMMRIVTAAMTLLVIVGAAAAAAVVSTATNDLHHGTFRCESIFGEAECSAAPATEHCIWNAAVERCTGDCTAPVANRTDCVSNPSCSWGDGACWLRCVLTPGGESGCNANPGFSCNWNGSACGFDCGVIEECELYSNCEWGPGGCIPSCRAHLARTPCEQDMRCAWDERMLNCFAKATPPPPPLPPTPMPPPAPTPPPDSCPTQCSGPSSCSVRCPLCTHWPNQGWICIPDSGFRHAQAKFGADLVYLIDDAGRRIV